MKLNTPFASFILGMFLVQLCSSIAYAVTFTVSKFDDTADGVCNADCSLREAVHAANSSPEDDTIFIPAGVYVLSIDGRGEDDGVSGDLDITDNVAIAGDGHETTIIDANGIDRIFHIRSANGIDRVTVRIDDLTVKNGTVDGENGGALFNASRSVVSLTNVTVRDSLTSNAGQVGGRGLGGGIYNEGNITLVDSTVSGNLSEVNQMGSGRIGGGGIFNGANAEAALRGVIVSGNRANNQLAEFVTGGGILNLGTLTIKESAMRGSLIGGVRESEGNRAHSGGGIANLGGYLTVMGSTIRHNSTFISTNPNEQTGATGGGIYNTNAGDNRGSLIINASTLSDNASDTQGGGLFNSGAPLTIAHSTIGNNTTRFLGGGISNVGSVPVEISSSTVAFNRVFDDTVTTSVPLDSRPKGGGIYTSSRINLASVTLAENSVDTALGDGGFGSQLYVEDNSRDGRTSAPQVTLTNTIVAENSLQNGIAIENCGGSTEFIVSQGYNIDSGDSCRFEETGDLANTAPLLDPRGLSANPGAQGGVPLTETVALLDASPAIDRRSLSDCPSRDQRFFERTNRCDVGAFELNAAERSASLADLKITMAADNDPAVVGSQLRYTITVTSPSGQTTLQE